MLANGVKETTATTGTGTVTLAAVTGYVRVAQAFAVGALVKYTLQSGNGTDLEWGLGTVEAGNTLARTKINATYVGGVYTIDGATAITLSGTSTVMINRHTTDTVLPTAGIYTGSDRYSYGEFLTSGAFANVANGTSLWFFPIVLSRPYRLATVAIMVATAGAAGSLTRTGIYASNSSGLPGALVYDAGSLATDTTGFKEVTLATPVVLMPGVYWSATFSSVGTPALRGPNYPSLPALSTTQSTAVLNTTFPSFRATGVAFGALPDPAPAVVDESNASIQPLQIKGRYL